MTGHTFPEPAGGGGAATVGQMLRDWRSRRRRSQLDLALDAGISQRHLSFVESGRSMPSRDMVLRLAERLAVPLREQNRLLTAAGFAPVYSERSLDDAALEAAGAVVRQILAGYEPHPALAVDRHWTMVFANRAVEIFLAGIDPKLLQPPVNALRVSLHPQGLASRIVNFREWRTHILVRLAHQAEVSADQILFGLMEELKSYPVPVDARPSTRIDSEAYGGVAVPLQLSSEHGVLEFLSTTTIFGTAQDITLSELAIEAFFPANAETAAAIRLLDKPPHA
ncbi:helix-turn-helix transcriptional regulator [uncultured Roseibium sp.]|uniref:helix-turn-helix domain-containing protein n=1 Tax=uncultured Roseibium sp. TaxID=1936171 RepID=UPI00263A0E0F|nr:helix-turn-helix transcriptional regulator [uncultured Roseibium sp.]